MSCAPVSPSEGKGLTGRQAANIIGGDTSPIQGESKGRFGSVTHTGSLNASKIPICLTEATDISQLHSRPCNYLETPKTAMTPKTVFVLNRPEFLLQACSFGGTCMQGGDIAAALLPAALQPDICQPFLTELQSLGE